jgi:hypothetical protein
MVSLRSAKLSIVNDNLEGSPNKPMVQSNEIVASMHVEKEYVNSLINNPITCVRNFCTPSPLRYAFTKQNWLEVELLCSCSLTSKVVQGK